MCEEDRRLPGRSLLAFAGGKEEPERAVYSEYLGFGIYTGEFMLRRGRFKYIHYVGERPQLFDLKEDPGQNHPIKDKAVEERMKEAMIRLMRESEAPEEQYKRLGLQGRHSR